MACNLILDVIPTSFTLKIPKQPFTRRVHAIITNTTYLNQNDRFYIARIIENGGKWVSPQHGGGYGQSQNFSPTSVEEYGVCDQFISWGWKRHGRFESNAYPLPSPMLSKLPNHIQSNQQDIIFVSTVVRKINLRFSSYLTINTIPEYRAIQLNFFKELKPLVLSKVLYRDHSHKFTKEDDLTLFLKSNKINSCETPAPLAGPHCRVMVIDHLGTTIQQAFVMNIPTILFWSDESFDLTDEALADFEELRKVGIWYRNEVDAANFLNINYDQIYSWWNSKEVQAAKDKFCLKYALASKNYLKEWAAYIGSHLV